MSRKRSGMTERRFVLEDLSWEEIQKLAQSPNTVGELKELFRKSGGKTIALADGTTSEVGLVEFNNDLPEVKTWLGGK